MTCKSRHRRLKGLSSSDLQSVIVIVIIVRSIFMNVVIVFVLSFFTYPLGGKMEHMADGFTYLSAVFI